MSAPTRRSLREQAAAIDESPSGPSPSASVPRRSSRRGPGRVLADALLWLAAIAGAACMVLVVVALTANITLIMFRTGSMSPTIPAGSVAVVQSIAASQAQVGDVVTVDREGDLPVTHRITSIAPGASKDERVITMRGDANTADDPYPYTVQTVRVVLFSVPGIATVIVAMGNPYVLGGLTLGATALVVWAFWPRSSKERRVRTHTAGAGR
ncbi:S26 family signal peptidase [Microbacterium sp. Leaf161]|uniref:signal peptidase I n=1 Tax=Microbacterium sp. Leaf161 TaxID=1736281 RepID=UPI0006F95688|nr:signal peptidase I [Microbacterium sp. Leaf161]KQR47743.1 S26 family signal peptidase [Microbacterium sp. Leaf161]